MKKGLFIGRSTVDLMSYVETFPEPDQKVKAIADFIGGGGTALNAAVTFSYLGGESTLFTSLGKEHLYKTIVLNDLSNFSVKVNDICCDDSYIIPLSNIISTRVSAQRLIINASQPECCKIKKIEKSYFENDYGILELDQYEYSFFREHIDFIKGFKGTVILDAGTWKPYSMEYLQVADIPIVSEEFVKGGAEEFAGLCRDLKVKRWAMTLGAKGICFSDNNKTGLIPAKKIKAADTLGAGDIFHGAFCYYYVSGYNFSESLEKANCVAAESCQSIGTRSWMKK